MKLKELKAVLNTLTEKQLESTAVLFEGDDEIGKEIDSWEESQEDIYWYEGDCWGDAKTAQEGLDELNKEDDDKLTLEDLFKVPKGTVTFHANLIE